MKAASCPLRPGLLFFTAYCLLPTAYCFPLAAAYSQQIERTTIDGDFPGVYQVEVADVNGDRKPDIIAVGGSTCAWYENPTWKKRVVTGPKQTPGIISSATADLDGDGKAEIAIAYEFAMNAPAKGKLLLAVQGGGLDDPWRLIPMADVGSIHRLRWGDVTGDGKLDLVVAPIFGPQAKPPKYESPAQLVAFHTDGDPKSGRWSTYALGNRPVIHAIEVRPMWQVRGNSVVLTADNLGVSLIGEGIVTDGPSFTYSTRTLVSGAAGDAPKRGCSEIHLGRMSDGRHILTTLEPWHGNQVVVYSEVEPNLQKLGPRTVLDNTLADGHALWVADVDGDGDDEVFAGHRGKDHRVSMYDFDRVRKTWKRTVLDRDIAAQDLRGGDLDGDGTPDVVAVGGATHNVVWYRFRRKLTGDNARRADELDKAIEAALKADRWDQAIARAEELLALRARAQGPKHFETVNAEWLLKALRRVAPMAEEDRVAYKSAWTMNEQARALRDQGKYAAAQPLFEKALEINRRLLSDDHPNTATCYDDLAGNLDNQGKYVQAQSLYQKALEIHRRLLTDDHPSTANSYNNAANNLTHFSGLERAGTVQSMRPALAAVLARLGQPAEAWQRGEEDLGRGLLDELAARQDRRLTPAERGRLRELTAALEQLDRLVETTPQGLNQAGRAKRFAELRRQRELASIALGEFQTKLVQDHGPLAGQVARLNEIQAALPADAALIAWVDIAPAGPNAADPDGEHWGMVVRSRGIPAWVPIAGTGPDRLWTKDDTGLAARVRTELRRRPGASPSDLRPLVERLRTQRLDPLAKALGATADGQPPAERLIVLPSRAMAGIPIEAILADDDTRIVSYAPSATVFKYLREQPRPDRHAGLLALGDPVYDRPDQSSDPKPLPDHGLLVNAVVPGSNAATHGLKPGDVLLAYNGHVLNKKDDLKVVSEGDKPIGVDVWRDGLSSHRDLAPGKLGVVLDVRPGPVAIAENRKLQQVLVAARGGDEDFAPLPGTRSEVEALARLFQSDDRPTRILLAADASEPELDHMATSGELGRFGFIHLATHGVIDEAVPARSAVILTQTGLPDPLQQALSHQPVFDGRLSVREIQRGWDLKAELVTLSACETALSRARRRSARRRR